MSLLIRSAARADTALILQFIHELAAYEELSHMVKTTEPQLEEALFGQGSNCEVVLAFMGDAAPAGFALFFSNFSTFLGQKGLYLEDLFVRPAARGQGVGKALMVHLAQLAVSRNYGRFEWSVLDWNTPSIDFYRSLGAVGMDQWKLQRVTGEALAALAAQ